MFRINGEEASARRARTAPEAMIRCAAAMALGWIRDYAARDDVCSLAAHRALWGGFSGDKIELVTRETISAFEG
jgi:hypothetical protein